MSTPKDFLPISLRLTASKQNLRLVNYIRYLAVAGQFFAVSYTHFELGELSHLTQILVSVGVLLSLALFTSVRINKGSDVTQPEFFIQLVGDVACFTSVLYFTGGSTNPFVSYFLIPLTITAATLPWVYTWLMASLTLSAYSALMFFYIPLTSSHDHHSSSFSLHVFGMWMNFLISALLITFFVVKMAQALRKQEAEIAEKREASMRDQQLIAIATVAAGAAHELGTPLSTMAVLLDDLESSNLEKSDKEDISIIQNQVNQCKKILQTLSRNTEISQLNRKQLVVPSEYLRTLTDRWQLLRPAVVYKLSLDQASNTEKIEVDYSVDQALISLLNNAADATNSEIEIYGQQTDHSYLITIKDHGDGLPMEISKSLGMPLQSTKESGLGLGLFLSKTSIENAGGTLKIKTDKNQGTTVFVEFLTHEQ